jgi:hypothetical protein
MPERRAVAAFSGATVAQATVICRAAASDLCLLQWIGTLAEEA